MERQIILLYLLTGIGQYTLDSYLPSLPKLADYFLITPVYMQYTIGIFLIVMALSQPIYGIFSDIVGRKTPLIIGISILALGTIICMLSQSYKFFLLGRILQGLGIGATSTLCKAMAKDLYSADQLKKVMSTMVIIWGFSLLIAPFIGGFLTDLFNWRSVFISQIAIQVICFILLLTQKETLNKKLYLSQIGIQIAKVGLPNSNFFVNTIICAICASFIYSLNMVLPFYIQNNLGYSPSNYGFFALLLTSGYIIGSAINKRQNTIKATTYIRKYLSQCVFIFFIFMFMLVQWSFINIITVFISLFFVTLMVGYILPSAMSSAFDAVLRHNGTASALYGLLVFGGGLLTNIIVSSFIKTNFLFLLAFLLILSVMLILFVRTKHFQAEGVSTLSQIIT